MWCRRLFAERGGAARQVGLRTGRFAVEIPSCSIKAAVELRFVLPPPTPHPPLSPCGGAMRCDASALFGSGIPRDVTVDRRSAALLHRVRAQRGRGRPRGADVSVSRVRMREVGQLRLPVLPHHCGFVFFFLLFYFFPRGDDVVLCHQCRAADGRRPAARRGAVPGRRGGYYISKQERNPSGSCRDPPLLPARRSTARRTNAATPAAHGSPPTPTPGPGSGGSAPRPQNAERPAVEGASRRRVWPGGLRVRLREPTAAPRPRAKCDSGGTRTHNL